MRILILTTTSAGKTSLNYSANHNNKKSEDYDLKNDGRNGNNHIFRAFKYKKYF